MLLSIDHNRGQGKPLAPRLLKQCIRRSMTMADMKNPVTNPQLVEALKALHQEKTPFNQGRVLELVATKANFLAPVVLTPVEQGDGKKKAAIQFQLVTNKDGQAFLPAFTDLEELKKFVGDKQGQSVVLRFDNYAAMLEKESKALGMVVNPMGLSLTLDRGTVARLAAKKAELAKAFSEQKMEQDTQVMIGDPVITPEETLEAVCQAVESMEEVARLWVRQMVRPDGVQSYVIVVDHSGDQNGIFQQIAQAARSKPAKLPVDMIPYGTPFAQTAVDGVEPFYTRDV